jgi:hypothetical protein
MYLQLYQIKPIIEEAILEKKILIVTYHRVNDTITNRIRTKAPFDLGTTNPKYYERNKNNLYMFCYEHVDEKTGYKKPMVHGISALHILDIKDSGKNFDPIELSKIHYNNTNYDYRTCNFALVPNRNWY